MGHYFDVPGTISSSIGWFSSLTSLDFSNNQLGLTELYLFKNEFTGTLSSLIGQFDSLQRLHLSHNAFTGPFPKELRSDAGSVNGIRPIKYFNIYSNQFTGTIPSELRWRKCEYFDIGRNKLTGTLPKDLGVKFVSLRQLHIDHNKFSGTVPYSYVNIGNGRLTA